MGARAVVHGHRGVRRDFRVDIVGQDIDHRAGCRHLDIHRAGGRAAGGLDGATRLEAWPRVGGEPDRPRRDRHGFAHAVRQHVRAAADLHGEGASVDIHGDRGRGEAVHVVRHAEDREPRHGDIQERADVVDHRFRRSGVDHHDGRVQLPVESADRVDGDVLYFGRGPEDAPQPVPVARTEHAAPFPARLDGGAGADFRLPVLPLHPGRHQRHLHGRFPGDYPRAILVAAGVVLRHRVAVRADGRHLYRRRAAGAVRLGQPRMDVRRGGAGVHHRLPADREPDSLAEGLAAHDGPQPMRRVPRRTGDGRVVRRSGRVPRTAGHGEHAGHLQGVHEALCAGGVAADERSGAGEEVQGRGGRRGVQ